MSCSRKIVLVLLALILVATLLPFTREQLDWQWATAEKQSDTYINYLGRWPEGRHVEQAREALAKTRAHDEQKAEALYAMSSQPTNRTKAEIKLAQQSKQDEYFWHRAATANTAADYNVYLGRFPNGKHAEEARKARANPGLPEGN